MRFIVFVVLLLFFVEFPTFVLRYVIFFPFMFCFAVFYVVLLFLSSAFSPNRASRFAVSDARPKYLSLRKHTVILRKGTTTAF